MLIGIVNIYNTLKIGNVIHGLLIKSIISIPKHETNMYDKLLGI